MIEVKNLTKRYGQTLALDRVSFKIEEGTIVGFLGPQRRWQVHRDEHHHRLPLRHLRRGDGLWARTPWRTPAR